MKSEKKPTVMDLKKWRDEAIEAWLNGADEAAIKEQVTHLLDSARDQIVTKLLGFDNHWGKWEIDHCNGRADNSEVGQAIRAHCRTAVMQWIAEVEPPKLNEAQKAALRKEYQQALMEALRRRVVEEAQNYAQQQVDVQALIAILE